MAWANIFEDAIRAGIGMNAAVYALAAIGLNVQFGYTGLMNYGQVGFALVGAYGTAISVDKWGLPLPVGFLIGVLAAIGLGLLLGLPTLRLRADYLAIVTISAAEILRIVTNSRAAQDVTGGPQGLKQFANSFFRWNPINRGRYGIGGVTFSNRDLWAIFITWGIVAVVSLLVFALVRSPWGRVVKSIREDEDAARSLGKNVFSYKMQSLVLGGVFGGLAGIMLVVDRQFVEPKNFESSLTFFAYAALILGGLARILGPVVGAMIFWFVISGAQSFLNEAIANGFLGIDKVLDPADVGPVRFMLVGLIIMGLVIFRPQGVLGSREDVVLDE
ncbi:MAG: branched-chain amino acid transport system permease protein [Actinomycetota bacterium]|nr:branched-chain amino acid transport system permease protein [Actinomycetota bacterium]